MKKVTNVVFEAVRSLSSYAKGDLKIADTIKKAQERIQALIQGGSVNEAVSVFVSVCKILKQKVDKQQENIKFMYEMYGFEKKEVLIMDKIRNGLATFDPDLTESEIDWLYTRLIGRMVYGEKDSDWEDRMKWDATVTTDLFIEDKVFVEVIGLTKEEYQYLKYKIRVQNQILGDVEKTNYNFFKYSEKIRNEYKSRMEKALGQSLTDSEFEILWKTQYENMKNASDYAHYNITTAAIMSTDYPPAWWNIPEGVKRSLANWFTGPKKYIGGNDSTREDMAGWLGDAVLKTAKDENGVKHVSFTQDDYKADLDAENIMNIVKTEGISYQDAHQKYFERLKNGETRATIFLSHTSLEYVEKTIFEHLDVETLDELKEEEPDTYNFILNLQNGTNEWRDYR